MCRSVSVLNGTPIDFEERLRKSHYLRRGDLLLYVFRYLMVAGAIVVVEQARSLENEDAMDKFFISGRPFSWTFNYDYNPSNASHEDAVIGVNKYPRWGLNSNTYRELSPEGRKKVVFYFLALKRAGLPSVCSDVVLKMCDHSHFGPGLMYCLDVNGGDDVSELVNMDPNYHMCISIILPECPGYETVEDRLMWTP